MKKALIRTKWFVISGVLMSCLSFFTTQKGWSEIYPFYFWKLYSQPAGWAYSFNDLRVYGKNEKDLHWTRIKNEDRSTFKRDETLYFLRHVVGRLETPDDAKKHEKDLKKLQVFCEFYAPEFECHKVVRETYNPKEIVNNPTNYDTTTVVQVQK